MQSRTSNKAKPELMGFVPQPVLQGHALGSSVVTFVLVVAGAAFLIWRAKPK